MQEKYLHYTSYTFFMLENYDINLLIYNFVVVEISLKKIFLLYYIVIEN